MTIDDVFNNFRTIPTELRVLFDEWLEYQKRTGISVFCCDDQEYSLLYNLALLPQVQDILELGPGAGCSTMCFINALNLKGYGSITSVDILPEEALKVVNDRARFTRFEGNTNAFFGQCTEKYDLIFVDADHSTLQSEKDIENALKFLNPNGIIACHDLINIDGNGTRWGTDIQQHVPRQANAHRKACKLIEDIGHGMGLIY